MLPVAEAQARVVAPLRPLASEWVTLPHGRGRVLAADLRAKRDHPRMGFTNGQHGRLIGARHSSGAQTIVERERHERNWSCALP